GPLEGPSADRSPDARHIGALRRDEPGGHAARRPAPPQLPRRALREGEPHVPVRRSGRLLPRPARLDQGRRSRNRRKDEDLIVSIRRATAGDSKGILDCLRLAFEPYREEYTRE